MSRQPIALALAGERLFVANRHSGTVSIIDPEAGRVLAELAVGDHLSDLAASKDGRRLFVTDDRRDQLVMLQQTGSSFEVVQRLSIGGAPVTVCPAHRHLFCSVASLWGRRVTLVSVPFDSKQKAGSGRSSLTVLWQIDLPFAPRVQCLSSDDAWLFVADSFGGNIAVIDIAAARLTSICRFDGHNIRGLAMNEAKQELVVAQQLLDEQIATTQSHISWGGVISNVLRSIALDALLPETSEGGQRIDSIPAERQLAHWSLDPLGKTGDGMGDPGPILLTASGRLIVTLSGVDKIALRLGSSRAFEHCLVGVHPVALVADSEEKRLFVANQFDDSISLVNLQNGLVENVIALGPRPELSAADRGERLFYNARLSLHGWYSCQSCHTDGHTNGLKNDNLGDETYGFPKRIPSLLGTRQTAPWAWNGRQPQLAQQVESSLRTTMHGPPRAASKANIDDLVAFLETLEPPPGLARARGISAHAIAERGENVFNNAGCSACHIPPFFTSLQTYKVGLHDKSPAGKFNPPSLRGVSQRGPYFHDSRAATLRDVCERLHHGETEPLPAADLEALLAYLNTL